MRSVAAGKMPALLAAAFFLVLSLPGCATSGRQGTVTVSGHGIARAQPDAIRMTIALRHIAPTTREAQAQVNGMVGQALEILRAFGVEERNIATAALRFSTEYDWGGPQGRRLLGQRAEQIISFSIEDIGSGNPASEIIDRLIGINGIELQGMQFGIRDAARLRAEARELAYLDALEKARQFAELSGQRIVRTLSVAEEGAAQQRQAMAMDDMRVAAEAAPAAFGATELPAGELEISARVLVEFLVR